MIQRRRVFLSVAPWLLVIGGSMAGCGSGTVADGEYEVAMAPLAQMPIEVQRAPAAVRQAYQFAAANPQVLQQVPCYCGCGGIGHTSVHSCYVAESANGARFDGHALGCSICVDIALDAMRLTKQGSSPDMIRVYIDMTYKKFGPSNMS